MTTPDGSPGAGLYDAPASDQPPAAERVTRPDPARLGPDRSGATSAASQEDAPTAVPTSESDDLAINVAVASSVKSAYDVLAETIEQGRKSAEQFRQGEYNMRDVPEDARHLAMRLLHLARQLSTSTFDVCEALLRQAPTLGAAPPPGATTVPPFQPVRPIGAEGPAPAPAQPSGAPAPAAAMRLTVSFIGGGNAIAHTTSLARPTVPTLPSDITCAALQPREGSAAPLTGVTFAADLADGGLVATVSIDPAQPAGTYAGAVYVGGQALPLGLIVVEVQG